MRYKSLVATFLLSFFAIVIIMTVWQNELTDIKSISSKESFQNSKIFENIIYENEFYLKRFIKNLTQTIENQSQKEIKNSARFAEIFAINSVVLFIDDRDITLFGEESFKDIDKISVQNGEMFEFFSKDGANVFKHYLYRYGDTKTLFSKKWDRDYLEHINVSDNFEIKIVDLDNFDKLEHKNRVFGVGLKDFLGNSISFLTISTKHSISADIVENVEKMTTITFLIFTLFISILSIFIYFFVSKPLFLLFCALKSRDYSILKELVNRKSEIGLISKEMINVFDMVRVLEQYKEALDTSAIVSKSNIDGKITYVNDEFCKISGYKQEELLWQNHNILKDPENSKEMYEQLWNTILSGDVWRGVIKNRNKNREVYYVKSTIVPIKDKSNNILEFISIRYEITDMVTQLSIINSQNRDFLTDLPNRQKLSHDLSLAVYPKLALINIDRFRDINDAYGHELGDEILKKFATKLKEYLTPNITPYRISGDEFAILSDNDVSENEFLAVCRKVLESFDSESINVGEFEFDLSIRLGIAFGFRDVLIHAEMAITHAQEIRENLVCFDQNMDYQENIKNNILWTKKIKEAIKEQRFEIFAQKIVANREGLQDKYETLIRMIDTNGDIISPYYFIDHSKKARLYSSITTFVLTKSIEFFKNRECEFSVNLTYEDIASKETSNLLLEMVEKHDIGDRLIVEIVESEGIYNYKKVVEFINVLKMLGCKIAIDDFGTGYSNFEYLINLNIDIIKIDGSLIKSINKDRNSYITVKTVVNFAKQLNIQTVAEFVHSKEVLEVVKSLDIDYSQGFYLAEPISTKDLIF